MFLLILLSINLEEEISSEETSILSLIYFLASFTAYLHSSKNAFG